MMHVLLDSFSNREAALDLAHRLRSLLARSDKDPQVSAYTVHVAELGSGGHEVYLERWPAASELDALRRFVLLLAGTTEPLEDIES